MTKIIPIRFSDIKKITQMIEYITPRISSEMMGDKNFVHFPFNIFHNILPLHLKFLQECYVAIENNEPLGLISLAPDGHARTRWKINRLVLGMNAYDIGKQLIDYVVNKYGGAGVESFITVIDENYPEAISLFKNVCFFRNYSKINIWEYENPKTENIKIKPGLFKKAEQSDAQKLFELDSEAIFPHLRSSLVKTAEDFKVNPLRNLINEVNGFKTEKYILDNPANKSIEGFSSIFSTDNKHFWVDITLSLAYQEYYEDFINFAVKKIKLQNPNAKIYMGVKDYHQIGKFMTHVLSAQSFKLCGNFQVLVKDYWMPIKDYNEKKAPAIIFPDMTSPACNLLQFLGRL